MFFCQLGQEMLNTTNPKPVIQDAVVNLTEIASYLFREESLEFAVHGSQSKFSLIEFKLEMLLNQMKNNNSRYLEKLPAVQPNEFTQTYFKTFFKTPLAVNNNVESLLGPTYLSDDYAAG
jgi:Zn-dependent M16 (insulinase) family peptidase